MQEEQVSIARNKPVGASLTVEDITKMSYGSKVGKSKIIRICYRYR